MIDFLKNFFTGEKPLEEKIPTAKKHDVLNLGDYAIEEGDKAEDDDFCAPSGGCCGGGCRS